MKYITYARVSSEEQKPAVLTFKRGKPYSKDGGRTIITPLKQIFPSCDKKIKKSKNKWQKKQKR